MLNFARRLVRRFLPRLSDPWLDAPVVPLPRDAAFEQAYAESLLPFESSDPFLAARYREGARWRQVLDRAGVRESRVLDIGSGSGAVGMAIGAGSNRAFTTDFIWNETARVAHRRAAAPYRHVIADAAALPFRDGAFDAVVCLEAIEHFPDAPAAGAEASRVLRGGGAIVLITPARLAWLFRPDPHFAIRGLLIFPPAIQRAIAARRGFGQPHHFVDRIYTSSKQLERLFPRCRVARTMTRARLPKRFFWDALLLRKDR